jgi:hypothetical protein
MKDLPLEVLRDLWLARFGPVVTYGDAHLAARNGEQHWSDVFTYLTRADHIKMLSAPLRIVVNQEKM